ncbi:MAG: hypothetical protein OCD03_10525 [Hyphomicrobiales bacterium]
MSKDTGAQKLPEKLTIDYYDDYMHIQKKWFTLGTLLLTGLLVIWMGIFWRVMIAMAPNFNDIKLSIAIILPVSFLMISLFLIYACAASWLNKTDIFVSQSLMEVRIGPLPWRGNLKATTEQIEQFYIVKKITKNKNTTKIRFTVMFKAIERERALIKGIEIFENAKFIEQKIEQYLGIENIAVENETDG